LTDGRTGGWKEFSWLDRVCILYSAVKCFVDCITFLGLLSLLKFWALMLPYVNFLSRSFGAPMLVAGGNLYPPLAFREIWIKWESGLEVENVTSFLSKAYMTINRTHHLHFFKFGLIEQ